MKVVGFLILPVVSFLVTLLAMMAVTGTLSKENFDKLLGREDRRVVVPQEEAPDDLDPIVRALSAREDDLDRRELLLKQDEDRLQRTRRELDELRAELNTLAQQITTSLDTVDATEQARLQDFAASLAMMKPLNAAQTLQELDPEIAGAVLRLMEPRNRGKVLDVMDPKLAASLLHSLQEPVY